MQLTIDDIAKFDSVVASFVYHAGAAAKLPFVNLHWYVYSLATPVNWTFHDPQLGPETLAGQGWAHMEKNWGRAFPDEWVWAQGMSLNKQASSQSAVQVQPCSPLTPLSMQCLSNLH